MICVSILLLAHFTINWSEQFSLLEELCDAAFVVVVFLFRLAIIFDLKKANTTNDRKK